MSDAQQKELNITSIKVLSFPSPPRLVFGHTDRISYSKGHQFIVGFLSLSLFVNTITVFN